MVFRAQQFVWAGDGIGKLESWRQLFAMARTVMARMFEVLGNACVTFRPHFVHKFASLVGPEICGSVVVDLWTKMHDVTLVLFGPPDTRH